MINYFSYVISKKILCHAKKITVLISCSENNATWKVAVTEKQMRISFVSSYLLRRCELTNLVIDAASFLCIYHDERHNCSIVIHVCCANTWVVLLKIEIMKEAVLWFFYKWRYELAKSLFRWLKYAFLQISATYGIRFMRVVCEMLSLSCTRTDHFMKQCLKVDWKLWKFLPSFRFMTG